MKVPVLTFAAFVASSPAVKISTVTQAKHPGDYDPRLDWWKQLREFLPRNHRDGGTKVDLDSFVRDVTDRKIASYTSRGGHYKDWWGERHIKWAGGSSATWAASGVDVTVNPELFVSVDGVRHVVKLYFKASERMTADRANVVLRLLELAYRGGSSPDGRPVVGLLDLAQGDFLTPTASLAYLDPLLAGEAASFSAIWKAV